MKRLISSVEEAIVCFEKDVFGVLIAGHGL